MIVTHIQAGKAKICRKVKRQRVRKTGNARKWGMLKHRWGLLVSIDYGAPGDVLLVDAVEHVHGSPGLHIGE